YINFILQKYLNKFYIIYINNIFIYTLRFETDFKIKIRFILQKFLNVGLSFNLNKYEFAVKKVKYFRFIIYVSIKIEIDLKKVNAIFE
ncbi:hypothetical protein QR685DRAFT_434939, partial [Neurospora intermedia]